MAASTQKSTGTYTFASQPRAVAPQRTAKYRDPIATEGVPLTYGNMMYDPRVVRGNTYRLQTTNSAKQPDPLELQAQQEKMRRTLAKKRAEEKLRTHTPDAVSGRQHTEVQTELYLEELTDKVDEQEVETQTDAFLDRPPSPLFVPVKSGVDVATQIEGGELFDFDVEVRPLLEVLVGKTVEQALMEVMEEEELARLRSHQCEYEELRNAELVETQRREEAARRAREEKDRRVRQARDALAKEKETSEKVAARAFAKNYVANLVPSVFTSLSTAGYFYDQQEREIESVFIPWLLDSVEARLVQNVQARDFLDALLEEVVNRQMQGYASLNPPPTPPAPVAAVDAAVDVVLAPVVVDAVVDADASTNEPANGEKGVEGGEGDGAAAAAEPSVGGGGGEVEGASEAAGGGDADAGGEGAGADANAGGENAGDVGAGAPSGGEDGAGAGESGEGAEGAAAPAGEAEA